MTIEGEAREALEELRRHSPGKSITEILAAALIAHRDRLSPPARAGTPTRSVDLKTRGKTRTHETQSAATLSGAKPVSRYVPRHIRRAVYTRDGGRCTFVAADGTRCDCDVGLQFDHVKPIAFGGETTVLNGRLLCPVHNRLAAKDIMGKRFIESHFSKCRGSNGSTAAHVTQMRGDVD